MKVVLDIQNDPKENDLLIFKDNNWVAISKNKLLLDLVKENEREIELIQILSQKIENVESEFTTLKQEINNKLKEYHEILKILSKGE